MDLQWAKDFAGEWVAAWNAHDLERVLSHYHDDFEMSSPLIVERMGEPSGKLRGKAAIRPYWAAGLAATPPLRFELLGVFAGVGGLTLHYRSVGRRHVTEVLTVNESGEIIRGAAYYGDPC